MFFKQKYCTFENRLYIPKVQICYQTDEWHQKYMHWIKTDQTPAAALLYYQNTLSKLNC